MSLKKLVWWLENILVIELEVEELRMVNKELLGMHTLSATNELSYPKTSLDVGAVPVPVALVPSDL